MNNQSPRSSAYTLFVLLLLVFLGAVGGYGYMRISTYYKQQSLQEYTIQKEQKDSVLATSIKNPEYQKLQLAKSIDQSSPYIPRFTQLRIVRGMLNLFQRFGSDSIVLSDFALSLEKVSINAKTKDLSILYQSGGLIDSFVGTKLISGLAMQKYENGTDGFEFSINANVVIDDESLKKICR